MKTKLFCLALAVLAMTSSVANGQGFLTNGLVAYYPLNGNAIDSSGYGNNGTVHGATPTTNRFGLANSACFFAGNGAYISIPNNNQINFTDTFSLSVWVQYQTGGTENSRIISKGWEEYSSGTSYELLIPSGTTPTRTVQFYTGNSTEFYTTNTISLGVWSHVLVIYDGTNLNTYINGILGLSQQVGKITAANDSDLSIGRNSMTSIDWFSGNLDDVRFYNRALSTSEIAQLYDNELQTLTIKTAVEIEWYASGGQTYQFQSSDNLTNWTDVGSSIVGNNGLTNQYFSINDTNKFFRIKMQ